MFYLITLIVAFCSIIYELVLAQSLSIIFGSTVKSYSITIGTYLMSMGIGSFLYPRVKLKKDVFFIVLEVLLSLVGILSIPFVFYISKFQYSYPFTVEFLSHMPIVVIGILSGIEVPLLTDIGKKSFSNILGVDYLGSLFGTVLFSFFLYPELGIYPTAVLVATFNLFVAVFYCSSLKKFKILTFLLIVFVIPYLILLSLSIAHQDELYSSYYKRYIEKAQRGEVKIQKVVRTPYQIITKAQVYESSSGRVDNLVYLGKHVQLSDNWREYYHETLSSVGVGLLETRPLSIAIMGGGDGQLVHNLLRYNNVKKIDLIDIDKAVIKFFKHDGYHSLFNGLLQDDSRVNIIIDDAYSYFRKKLLNEERYDIIYFDLPGLRSDSLLKLYSKEFFYSIVASLQEDGVFMGWMYQNDYFKNHTISLLKYSGMKLYREACATDDIARNSASVNCLENFFVSTKYVSSKLFSSPYFTSVSWHLLSNFKTNVRLNSVLRPNYRIMDTLL